MNAVRRARTLARTAGLAFAVGWLLARASMVVAGPVELLSQAPDPHGFPRPW